MVFPIVIESPPALVAVERDDFADEITRVIPGAGDDRSPGDGGRWTHAHPDANDR
jgi:hypothetical protein